MYKNKLSTTQILLFGGVFSIVANIPFYAWIFNKHWVLAKSFPVSWIGVGMNYMATFFHEIGHTISMWFFGYPAIPAFDFAHGGGISLALTGQQIPILVIVWGFLGYSFWLLKGYKDLQIGIILLFLFNIVFAFNQYHVAINDFMGAIFECLVAAFFIYRALFNLAPRGDLERFLNAFFGFGMIFQVFVNSYGLLSSSVYRLAYYQQKGSHGFGDFDKIVDRITFLNFDGVIYIWIFVNILCLLLPFVLFIRDYKNKELFIGEEDD